MSFFLPSILFRYQYDQEMAVPTSWKEGRNIIVTTVSRKTAHRRISFLTVAVSAPERHWIGFQSHFARAAHETYSVGKVRSSGRTHIHTSARVAIQISPPNLSERGSLRSPITRVRVEYVIVKARQRGNYAANSPSPRELARGRGLLQHNFRGNPLL